MSDDSNLFARRFIKRIVRDPKLPVFLILFAIFCASVFAARKNQTNSSVACA